MKNKIIFTCLFLLLSFTVAQENEQQKSSSLLQLLPERTLVVAGAPNIQGIKSAWKNHSFHLLLQEPEVKRFVAPFKEQLKPLIQQGKMMFQKRSGLTLEQVLALPLQELIIAVVDVDLTTQQPKAAVSVNLGGFSQKLLDILTSQGLPISVVDANNMADDAPGQIFATILNGNLIATSDYSLMKELVQNYQGEPGKLLINNEDFSNVKKYMDRENETVVGGFFANIAQATDIAKMMLPPPVVDIMTKAHIQDIRSISIVSNLAGKDLKTRFFLGAKEGVPGLPEFLRGKPSNIDRFAQRFPISTTAFSVSRFHIGELLQSVEKLINTVDEEQQMGLIFQYQGLLQMANAMLGFDILDYQDAFEAEMAVGDINLSDSFLSHQIVMFPIKNGEKARQMVNTVSKRLHLQVKKLPHSKERIFYFVSPLGELGKNPFEKYEDIERNPAVLLDLLSSGASGFALSYDDNYAYFSQSVSGLQDYLEWKNSQKPSLSGNRRFIQEREKVSSETALFFYADQRKTTKKIWSVIELALNALEGSLRSGGIPLESALLPRSKTLVKHMGVSSLSLSYEKEGILLETNSSVIITIPAAVGIAAALLLPALSKVQEKAEVTRTMANLRQMGMSYQLLVMDYGRMVVYPPAGKVKFITILYKSNLLIEPEVFGKYARHEDLMNDNGAALDYEGTEIAIFRINANTTTTPIVWSKKGIHKGVRVVLFLDGHVEQIDEHRFQDMMVEQKAIAIEYAEGIQSAQENAEEYYGKFEFKGPEMYDDYDHYSDDSYNDREDYYDGSYNDREDYYDSYNDREDYYDSYNDREDYYK